MGVKGLLVYLRKKHPNSVLYLKASDFKGKRFAIDISTWMYQEMASCRNQAVPQMDLINKGYDEALVRKMWYKRLINKLITIINSGINPIIVFDGKGTDLKGKERAKRTEKFRKKKEEIAAAWKALEETNVINKPEMAKKLIHAYKNDTTINPADHELLKIVLASTGLCCLQSKVEADHLVAMLCYHGEVALAYSVDSDLVIHGSQLTGAFMTQKQQQKDVEMGCFVPEKGERYLRCYHLGYILESIGISFASFLDMAILLGIDYNDAGALKIKGLGAVNIEKLIKKYKYIDDIPLKELKKINKNLTDRKSAIAGYDHIHCRKEFSWSGLDELIAEFKLEENVDSDEELPDEVQEHEEGNASSLVKEARSDSSDRRGKLSIDDDDQHQVPDTDGDIDLPKPHLFGTRRTRYQIVNNSDMRTAFELVQIADMVPYMKSAIRHYLEEYPDDGEPGHLPNMYTAKRHVWTDDGKLYINDELIAEFM